MTQVIAVSLVKDEIDILPYIMDHLKAEGIDGFYIADNMSTDGTWQYLLKQAGLRVNQSVPVMITRDEEIGYYQASKMNHLVEKASTTFTNKEDVVILPFDADELFYSTDPTITLSNRLRQMGKGLTHATVYDHVPTNGDSLTGNPLVDMAYREPRIKALPSVAFSYEPGLSLTMGNHDVIHTGPIHENLIAVRHFQYRSFEHYKRKLRNGKMAYEMTGMEGNVQHWRLNGAKSDAELEYIWNQYINQTGLVYDPAPIK